MGSYRYILDKRGRPRPEPDLFKWAQWMETNDRHVAHDIFRQGQAEEIRVSTVFLGIDHNWFDQGPPILWETMIFGGDDKLDLDMQRYSSVNTARIGHSKAVEAVEKWLAEIDALKSYSQSVEH